MVRGDTLWGAAVYEGNFYALDVSNPYNPKIFNEGQAFHQTLIYLLIIAGFLIMVIIYSLPMKKVVLILLHMMFQI